MTQKASKKQRNNPTQADVIAFELQVARQREGLTKAKLAKVCPETCELASVDRWAREKLGVHADRTLSASERVDAAWGLIIELARLMDDRLFDWTTWTERRPRTPKMKEVLHTVLNLGGVPLNLGDRRTGLGYFDNDSAARKREDALILNFAHCVREGRLIPPLAPDETTTRLNPRLKGELPHGLVYPAVAGLVIGANELVEAMTAVVENAKKVLWCTGSRSRTAGYLAKIRNRLMEVPELVHYRVLYGPPVNAVLRDHLLEVLDVRDPRDRTFNVQTVHIGIYEDHLENRIREAEHFVCANERTAVVALPSVSGITNFDTCLYIEDEGYAAMFGAYCVSLYNGSTRIETKAAVAELPVLRESDDVKTKAQQ